MHKNKKLVNIIYKICFEINENQFKKGKKIIIKQ